MDSSTKRLVGIFTVSGILHFVRPEPFVRIVPKPLPYKKEIVYASGAAELACAGLLVSPSTRSLGGRLSYWLLLAVFPANLQMSIDAFRNRRAAGWFRLLTIARLPLQLVFLRWARRATQGATG
jgi:uncharacterized membrane protein